MSQRANCFQIKGAEIISGFPPTSDVLNGKSLPWGDSWNQILDPSGPREYWVKYSNNKKNGTRWISGGHQPHDINPNKGYLFYFDVADLHFEEGPLMEGLNLWPGAEWHTVAPFWRQTLHSIKPHRMRHTPNRAEIWVRKINEELILIDTSGGVRILRSSQGKWILSPVAMDEMVQYLTTRGLAMSTHSGVMWALRNLEMICKKYRLRRFDDSTHTVRKHLSRIES